MATGTHLTLTLSCPKGRKVGIRARGKCAPRDGSLSPIDIQLGQVSGSQTGLPLAPCGRGLRLLASPDLIRGSLEAKGEGYPAGHWPTLSSKPAAPASPQLPTSRAQPASPTPANIARRCPPHPLSPGSALPRQEKEPSPSKGRGGDFHGSVIAKRSRSEDEAPPSPLAGEGWGGGPSARPRCLAHADLPGRKRPAVPPSLPSPARGEGRPLRTCPLVVDATGHAVSVPLSLRGRVGEGALSRRFVGGRLTTAARRLGPGGQRYRGRGPCRPGC
jgi:hypothetical protein